MVGGEKEVSEPLTFRLFRGTVYARTLAGKVSGRHFSEKKKKKTLKRQNVNNLKLANQTMLLTN